MVPQLHCGNQLIKFQTSSTVKSSVRMCHRSVKVPHSCSVAQTSKWKWWWITLNAHCKSRWSRSIKGLNRSPMSYRIHGATWSPVLRRTSYTQSVCMMVGPMAVTTSHSLKITRRISGASSTISKLGKLTRAKYLSKAMVATELWPPSGLST